MFGNGIAGIGNLHGREFFCCKENHFFFVVFFEHLYKLFICLYVYGTILMRTGKYATIGKSLVNLVVDTFVIFGMMGQPKTYCANHRYEMQFEHTVRCVAHVGSNHDKQLVFTGVCLGNIVDNSYMVGFGRFQIVRSFIAGFQQKGCRLTVHEGKDAVVHIVDIAGYRPVETLLESI